MTEESFLQQVRQLATITGWLSYHTRSSRHSDPGFPDLSMVRDNRAIFVELKSRKGKLTLPQRCWLVGLCASGNEVYLWKEESWPQIQRVLR